MHPNRNDHRADWLSFILHAIFGLILGLIGGAATVHHRRFSPFLDEYFVLPFILGTGLFLAGLGAKYGDRLWLGDTFRTVASDRPKHNTASTLLAFTLMVTGLLIAVFSALQ